MKLLILPVVILIVRVLTEIVVDTHVAQPNGKESVLTNAGALIPASATMATAWDIPKNPLTDSTLSGSPLTEQIRRGFKLFIDTPHEAPQFSPNRLSCNNCHLNGGQKEKAMPLVGVGAVYPEYNKRAGRVFSLEDRIVGCFMRSQNATGRKKDVKDNVVPSTNAKEVLALAAYISWLSDGYPIGKNLPWRGQNVIPSDKLLPVDRFDPRVGETLFKNKCSSCHGEDGQGVEIGDKRAGPLWGPDSWNDGAGAARVYTLAGMIRFAMPYLDPGSLTDEEAQQIAAYINSKSRPEFPFKHDDWGGKFPPDAVYYKHSP